MRLQSKIILLTTPVVVVSMLALGAISSSFLRKTTVNQAFNAITMFMDSSAGHFQSTRDGAYKDVELISSSSILQQYMLTPDENERYTLMQPPLIRLFNSYQKSHPSYYEMRVFLPDGYEDARVVVEDLENASEEEGNSEIFQAMHGTPHNLFSSFFVNPDNNHVALLVSRRIVLRDPNRESISTEQELRGYVAITIDSDFIATRLAEFRDEYETTFFLVNSDGRTFYRTGDPELTQILSLDQIDSIRKNTDSPFTEIHGGPGGYFVSARQFGGDVFLISVTSKRSLLAESNRLSFFTGLASILAILVVSFLLFVACRKMIVDPVRRLGKAAREFGGGNLTADVLDEKTPRNDEIGELSRSFSEMRKNLLTSQDQIRQLAYYDFLTGLPNRLMFQDFLTRTLSRSKRCDELLALLFIDLDDFKRINDTLGHKLGDDLLKKVATRLSGTIRRSDYIFREITDREPDMIARLGGDEFTVLLTYIKDQNDAAVIARRMLQELISPFIIDEHELYVRISIGITIYPNDADTPEELIKNADIAMYHAKELGKNNYQYFSVSMNEASLERLNLEGELRRAIEKEEFFLHFQPQVDTVSTAIVGLEALIRWQHPVRGIIPPVKFIPVAEESGLIVPIGEWVLRQTARQIRIWKHEGKRVVPVSINLSSPQFQHIEIDTLIAKVLQEEKIDPKYLKVELTESILLKAEGEAIRMLHSIKDTGVQICLDDFGTGFSSLNYLKLFPIDVLKIDRSFVRNIAIDNKDAEISSAIIALGKCLNLSIVAEGVEEKEQYDFLRDKGCDVIQGFYFHKPLPAEKVAELLQPVE
ncbi:MAG: EAL domain-containing protein [Pseudomonadota bacterium]